MTSFVPGRAPYTTVLNPPNLNGFGAAANKKHALTLSYCDIVDEKVSERLLEDATVLNDYGAARVCN